MSKPTSGHEEFALLTERQSAELFRLLVASVKEYAIFMLDPQGRIATWNAGARRIKGYEAQEIIGRHFSTFYPEEDVRNGKPERELEIAREQGSVEDEGWRLRKDGTRFWANVVITAVRDASGELRGFAKVTRDLTERKQAEELRYALLEQREARLQAEEERRRAEESYHVAQESNRAKDEFLMTLSHELRTPMTAILGWARLLPTLQRDDAIFDDALAAIGRAAQLQTRLIDDVLDVSRVVSGKLRLSRENVAVEDLMKASIDAVRPMAEARGITITTAFASDLGMIVADPTRLQQVVWNLLTNAVKFTPKGGVVAVIVRNTASHVQIAVRDNGEGIEPGFLPHVFEPFRQAEGPRTRVHGGLGLGLSIVRYLVEAHGGTVLAESEGRGRGATFTVTFPIAALHSRSEEEPALSGESTSGTIAGGRLANVSMLMVDDDRETRQLVCTVLRQAGANVTAVASGSEGLALFERNHPDIVMTDVAMPGMDGYEFARSLRRNDTTGTKIVALTAFPAGTQAAEASGFDAYLTKPMDPVDLVEAIAKVAGRG